MARRKPAMEAKVRPVANASLERASLLGAARIYVCREALAALTGGLENGARCVVQQLEGKAEPRREASLWILPEKNVSPNVVMMARAFQEASGFKIGDIVSISLVSDHAPMPDAALVVAVPHDEDSPEASTISKHPPCWEFALALSLDRAEDVFPGMVMEGVSINKLRRSFKILSVDSRTDNVARFRLASTTVRILPSAQEVSPAEETASAAGDLVLAPVPGLAAPVEALNRFLRAFNRPFWVQGERESCAFVLHGGHGTGKTLILRRLADSGWGHTLWIQPSDKLSLIRDSFKQARALQPSILLIDGLEELLAKERPNREAIIEALADELDALSAEAAQEAALPRVVVVASCLDYMTDVPPKLQRRSRFRENAALPIPRAPERLEILRHLDPPMPPEEKERWLAKVAQQTHAYNGDDLANLVLTAKRILGNRLDDEQAVKQPGSPVPDAARLLRSEDVQEAVRRTRPSAMRDINLKPPTIHWQDVGGQESLKRVLARMIKHSKASNPASRRVLRHPPKGLLLYGPPGCSKTLSAQAMATESGFNFFAVKGAELLNMYVGESERAVRTLFERARAASPSIIFFDEIDSIGGQRAASSSSSSSSAAAAARGPGAVNMLTTLLTEMDGFESLTGVLILAATNRPEAIDPALLRPGRFDQVLYVGPPDQTGREAVFAVHLRGLSLAPDIDLPQLARLADGCSGAEIKAACNEAGLAVLDRFDEAEDADPAADLVITMADLVAALERTPRNITPAMLDGYDRWSRQFRRL